MCRVMTRVWNINPSLLIEWYHLLFVEVVPSSNCFTDSFQQQGRVKIIYLIKNAASNISGRTTKKHGKIRAVYV